MNLPANPRPETADEAALRLLEQAECELLNARLFVARAAARLYDAGREAEALELRRSLHAATVPGCNALRDAIDRRRRALPLAEVIRLDTRRPR